MRRILAIRTLQIHFNYGLDASPALSKLLLLLGFIALYPTFLSIVETSSTGIAEGIYTSNIVCLIVPVKYIPLLYPI